MILHTFNQPGALERHQQHIQPEDAVLLLEDGVFDADILNTIDCSTRYALRRDLNARGLSETQDGATVIDDSDWVALVVRYDRVVSWA
jgi:sulfur relay protein TusB/DsrH